MLAKLGITDADGWTMMHCCAFTLNRRSSSCWRGRHLHRCRSCLSFNLPFWYRMDLLFLFLALDMCCVCSYVLYAQVKLSRLFSKKWHRFFRTLPFSNHEPARHERHHESRLHTGWRGQQTASVATRCVSSQYRSIMKRAWSRRHDLFQRQLLHGPDLSEFRRWNKEAPKTQRSCCREVAKKHGTCEHQNCNSLKWLCLNFVELNVW